MTFRWEYFREFNDAEFSETAVQIKHYHYGVTKYTFTAMQ